MKKVCSLLLVFALVLSMSVVAFAEQPVDKTFKSYDGEDFDDENTVTATGIVSIVVNEDGGNQTKYKVEVKWESLTFTYDEGTTESWNPDGHNFTGGIASTGWDKTEANITVVNHSNAVVTVKADVTDNDANDNVTYALSAEGGTVTQEALKNNGIILERDDKYEGVVDTTENHCPSCTITVAISNNGIPEDSANAATITVTIAK